MQHPNKFSFVNPKKSPVFYGYVVLFVGSIGVLASIPGQTVGSFKVENPQKDS